MYKNIGFSLVAGLLGGFLVLLINHFYFTQNFAVVDIAGLVDSHVSKYSQIEDEDDKRLTAAKFKDVLSFSLDIVAEDNNVVFLNSRAVISDLPNYTGLVSSVIQENMGEAANP